MASGIMAAAPTAKDVSLDMKKEAGKMQPACLAFKLIVLMSLNAKEGPNLWKFYHDHFLIYAVNIR